MQGDGGGRSGSRAAGAAQRAPWRRDPRILTAAAAGLADLDGVTLALLALCGLVGGIGITALGPGGVVVTIGLFALSGLPPAVVAGTAIATHVGSGTIGTAAYVRSGQLRERRTLRIAAILVVAAALGTPLGVMVNARVSPDAFGALLGGCVATVGLLLYLRERRRGFGAPEDGHRLPSTGVVAGIGLGVAVASGLFGLGGPLLSVPLLVAAGTPMLPALGAAQVQSIVIAGAGTVGYAAQDAISWPLVLVVGVPELVGVLVGWKLAQRLPTHRLRVGLAGVLVIVGPYLAIHGA